jgi:hypothetical protein
MENEMKMVFQQKVNEKEAKLKLAAGLGGFRWGVKKSAPKIGN